MAVVSRIAWTHHKSLKDSNYANEHTVDMNHDPKYSSFQFDNSWKRKLSTKQNKGHWVPTLSGMIKAGDEAVYSSSLFHQLVALPGEITLQMLNNAFAEELKKKPAAARAELSQDIAKFISATTHTRSRRRSRESFGQEPKQEPAGRHRSRSSIDILERGLSRSTSRSKKSNDILVGTCNPVPSSQGKAINSWAHDLRPGSLDGKSNIIVTPPELAALAITLGIQPEFMHDLSGQTERKNPVVHGNGAFGISMHAVPTVDERYQITLTQFKRKISQLPARGSGFSTLYAKHLASGSLPFLQDERAVNSILVTGETLHALKEGSSVHFEPSLSDSKAANFLQSLPSSRQSRFFALAPSTNSNSSTSLLLHAITAMPFSGGLVPIASAPLVDTVQFVTSAGLPAARLLQRLDALVDKVNRHSPHLQLFGPLFDDENAGLRVRVDERLNKLATDPTASEPIIDKAARMHRYTTLLERLMALVPDTTPAEVLIAVREALQRDIEHSYQDARAAHNNPDIATTMAEFMSLPRRCHLSNPASTTTSIPTLSPVSSPSCSPTTPKSGTWSPRRSSTTFPPHNLGKQVESILKASLPLSVETIAVVARLVLVAWTLSVERVAWEDSDEGVRLPAVEELPEVMAMR
ncbi:hypothetical protein BU24DRAFT_433605 [Aaosphaeria arxii CBS 175.79]|uniref:Uncharacterized protein n=1 Tax=Aaosphaeria arxii CBS 175.79 TaxID=1450172 RepID=A0A6A5XVD1_9PLEO|nr:uncharacterized protein BU24DRAFT_433605 [Aaosphaeria arxii CBS 175.79]KAF2016777.1 hypothetical protein BU24DRAFT_433605 [Aaosphaeria arxii CBS 175.79]